MTAAIPSIALVGNPNAGKSSLFNALTGARQKIANYPGVTVERKAGHASFADGRPLSLIDLPGTYSLTPASLDEAVTRDVVLGRQEGETRPDALIVVLDAANLDNHLSFALELLALDLPTVVALVVAYALRRTVAKGAGAGFMMELPRYQMPQLRDILLGLWQRAWIFLRRAGTIIAMTTVVLWLLLTFPQAPEGESQVEYSVAGRIASGLEVVVAPIGFNHDIALALIPAMAAREVAVSAMATANAIDADGDEDAMAESLGERLQGKWSLATALAFLAWFVFAPQCISTIAITRRETNGWKWPMFMVGYLFLLAYAAAGITYWTAVAFGLG